MSPKLAIFRGHLWINLPILLFFAAVPFVIYKLSKGQAVDIKQLVIGVIVGIAVSWLWWSFMITKWKLWAFSKTDNVHELKDRAIRSYLLYPTENFITKTIIQSKKDQEKWLTLSSKFNQSDTTTVSLPISYYYNSLYVFYLFWKNAFAPIVGIIVLSMMAMNATQNAYFWGSTVLIFAIILAFFVRVPLIGKFHWKTLIEKWTYYQNKQPYFSIDEKGIIVYQNPTLKLKKEDVLYAKVIRNKYEEELHFTRLQLYFSDSYYEQNNLEQMALSLQGLAIDSYELENILNNYIKKQYKS